MDNAPNLLRMFIVTLFPGKDLKASPLPNKISIFGREVNSTLKWGIVS